MRVWASSDSKHPHGWKQAKDAWEAIYFLDEERVDELSLAYDFGNLEVTGNGVSVLAWLHKKVDEDPFYIIPEINFIEVVNPLALEAMHHILNEILEKKKLTEAA